MLDIIEVINFCRETPLGQVFTAELTQVICTQVTSLKLT